MAVTSRGNNKERRVACVMAQLRSSPSCCVTSSSIQPASHRPIDIACDCLQCFAVFFKYLLLGSVHCTCDSPLTCVLVVLYDCAMLVVVQRSGSTPLCNQGRSPPRPNSHHHRVCASLSLSLSMTILIASMLVMTIAIAAPHNDQHRHDVDIGVLSVHINMTRSLLILIWLS
jgi:hypothetical protein